MKYIIYTDGACSGNPGPGGWGAIIIDEKKNQINLSGREKLTTNNRMELTAPIMALKKIKKSSEIIIYTDSTYLKNGITIWIKNWKKNNDIFRGIVNEDYDVCEDHFLYYEKLTKNLSKEIRHNNSR